MNCSSLLLLLLCLAAVVGFLATGGLCWVPISPDCRNDAFDEAAMKVAILQARKNPRNPFGAALFNCTTGAILAVGNNNCVSAASHGEMQAIQHWTQVCLADPSRGECTSGTFTDLAAGMGIASTGAPCSMCSSAIAWMGFGRVVFASNYSFLAENNWQPLAPDQQQVLNDYLVVNPYLADVSVRGNVLSDVTDPFFKIIPHGK